jgi:hypothetical protein
MEGMCSSTLQGLRVQLFGDGDREFISGASLNETTNHPTTESALVSWEPRGEILVDIRTCFS